MVRQKALDGYALAHTLLRSTIKSKEGYMTKAAQTIPSAHLEFIKMIACQVWRGLSPRWRMLVSVDDLVSEGYFGYMQAVTRFNASQGRSFETYAEWRIRGAMLDALRRTDTLSHNNRSYLNRVEKTEQHLTGTLGRPPTEEEIATALHLTILEYLELRGHCHPIEECSLAEALEHYPQQLPSTPDEYLAAEKRILLQQLLRRLRELLDQRVITLRTLLVVRMCMERGMEQKEIAQAMGVTPGRVSQYLTAAVAVLRA